MWPRRPLATRPMPAAGRQWHRTQPYPTEGRFPHANVDQMREIIDIRTVERAVWAWAVGFPVACLLVAGGLAAVGRATRRSLVKSARLAFLGPMVLGLWLVYSHLVRYDPRTGYFGLDKLWVLAANLCLFAVVGAAYGYLLGRAWGWQPTPASEAKASPDGNSPSDTEPTG